jgi:tRNA(Ile)-lysidine synthase
MNRENTGVNLHHQDLFEPLFGYQQWLIAYSGGLDSTVLLHLAICALAERSEQAEKKPQIRAIHVDHQLMPEHQQWADHCATECAKYSVPLISEKVAIHNTGQGLEQAARAGRYQVFEQHMTADTVLIMAHHANDQAETVLLRLLRGAGIRGAAAIPKQRALAAGLLCRPLLDLSRRQLHDYAKYHQLAYIDDASNSDTQFDRNYIRHQVIPVLAARWPKASDLLARFAKRSAEAELLLHDLAQIDLRAIKGVDEWGEYLTLRPLNALSAARRANALRHWLGEKNIADISATQLSALTALVDNSRAATHVDFHLPNDNSMVEKFECHIFDARLYFVNRQKACLAESANYACDLSAVGEASSRRLGWAATGFINLQLRTVDSDLILLKPGVYTLAVRRSGLNAQINGHTKSLKKLMQEAGIPPWMRSLYPVVYAGDKVAALGNKRVCDEFKAIDGAGWQLSIDWH